MDNLYLDNEPVMKYLKFQDKIISDQVKISYFLGLKGLIVLS